MVSKQKEVCRSVEHLSIENKQQLTLTLCACLWSQKQQFEVFNSISSILYNLTYKLYIIKYMRQLLYTLYWDCKKKKKTTTIYNVLDHTALKETNLSQSCCSHCWSSSVASPPVQSRSRCCCRSTCTPSGLSPVYGNKHFDTDSTHEAFPNTHRGVSLCCQRREK